MLMKLLHHVIAKTVDNLGIGMMGNGQISISLMEVLCKYQNCLNVLWLHLILNDELLHRLSE